MTPAPTLRPSLRATGRACCPAYRLTTSSNTCSRALRASTSGGSEQCREWVASARSTLHGAPSRTSRPCCGCAKASASPAHGPSASRTGCLPSASDFRWLTKPENSAGLAFPATYGAVCDRPREVGKRGACTLARGHIATLAGVCLTVAKRALRQARTLGLVTVEERRLSRSRNDTNVVRVASCEGAAWLRLRFPRASHAGLQGSGHYCARYGYRIFQRAINKPSSSREQAPDNPVSNKPTCGAHCRCLERQLRSHERRASSRNRLPGRRARFCSLAASGTGKGCRGAAACINHANSRLDSQMVKQLVRSQML